MTAPVRLVPVDGLEAQGTVRALHASVTGEPFVAAGLPDEVVESLVRLQFDAQQAEYRAWWPDSVDHVVVAGDRPVGRCWTAVDTSATHVLDLAIVPSARRQGHATTCLQSVIADSHAAGRDVTLAVRADNVGARALYAGLGFVEDGDPASPDADLRLRLRVPVVTA